jgi:RND family efflux transporter MFP subunit
MILLTLVTLLAGCKSEEAPVQEQLVRTLVVDPQPMDDDRYAVGEVMPRYESDLSFRVAGKVLSRLVDVGAHVGKGDKLATLDTQDFENRLRSADADVRSAEASLEEARGIEARKARLLKGGWTSQEAYDTALKTLRAADAQLGAARGNRDLIRDQLQYTDLKADFDGVITAVGAEPGENVNAGQMVVKLARPDAKDGVFNIAETALGKTGDKPIGVVVWPLSNPNLTVDGVVREISPVADPVTRTYAVKVTLNSAPPELLFDMSLGGRVKEAGAPVVVLPLSAIFEINGTPAVWVLDHQSSTLTLRPVSIARYDADTAIVASGLTKGDAVVTAGVNRLTTGQKVRVAEVASAGE